MNISMDVWIYTYTCIYISEFAPDDAVPDALILRGRGSGDEWVKEYSYNMCIHETACVYI